MPSVGTESWADRPWKKTQSHYAETIRRAWSVVWVEWPRSAQSGVCSSSPSESALAQKQPRSQQLNHLNFSSHNTSSPNPRQLHISFALDLGQTKQRKVHDLGAASEQNCRHLHRWFKGPLRLHRPHLLQQLPPLRRGTHLRATESDTEGFCSNNWGVQLASGKVYSNSHGAQQQALFHNLHRL